MQAKAAFASLKERHAQIFGFAITLQAVLELAARSLPRL
jgi:hypothetical protein